MGDIPRRIDDPSRKWVPRTPGPWDERGGPEMKLGQSVKTCSTPRETGPLSGRCQQLLREVWCDPLSSIIRSEKPRLGTVRGYLPFSRPSSTSPHLHISASHLSAKRQQNDLCSTDGGTTHSRTSGTCPRSLRVCSECSRLVQPLTHRSNIQM